MDSRRSRCYAEGGDGAVEAAAFIKTASLTGSMTVILRFIVIIPALLRLGTRQIFYEIMDMAGVFGSHSPILVLYFPMGVSVFPFS